MHDVIVIGGSYSGISAAIPLARARRDVLVVDGGKRRNRAAKHAHGFFGRDGVDPAAIAAEGRAQLLAYETVQWLDDEALHAARDDDGFTIELASGARERAKRIVLALGVVDDVPAIAGLAERWGTSVFACPYCHGYELDRAPVAVLATGPLSPHVAQLLPDWGATTYFAVGFEPSAEELAALARRGVVIDRTPVEAIEGESPAVFVRQRGARRGPFAGVFVTPRSRVASPIPVELGCALDESPVGTFIVADAMRATTVPGVFACGDAAKTPASIAMAVGDGMRAGVAAHQSLVFAT